MPHVHQTRGIIPLHQKDYRKFLRILAVGILLSVDYNISIEMIQCKLLVDKA